jgi:2,4-dienoyl-CoA reductase-like NADH-dependent reductase (Old Yellow Enzyme family)
VLKLFKVDFAEAVKKAYPDLLVGAVGLITKGAQAETYLQEKKADIIFLAREVLRDPSFVLKSAQEMGVAVSPPNQYHAAWIPMLTPKNITA